VLEVSAESEPRAFRRNLDDDDDMDRSIA